MKLYVARNDKIYNGWTGEELKMPEAKLSDRVPHEGNCSHYQWHDVGNLAVSGDVCSCYVAEVAGLEARVASLDTKYYGLLWAVATKHPNETRHETALRYIQECENRDYGGAKNATSREALDA